MFAQLPNQFSVYPHCTDFFFKKVEVPMVSVLLRYSLQCFINRESFEPKKRACILEK